MRFALVLLLVASPVIAQTAAPSEHAPPELQAPVELIDHLVANATLYNATLPSITASEFIESEGSYLIFHHTVKARGIFRVVRDPGGELGESRQITEVDGKPVTPGDNPRLPWTLFGGFGKFQELFFTPAHRLCYTFTPLLAPGPDGTQQLTIAENYSVAPVAGCVARGITGLVRIDQATQHLVYLERTVPEAIATRTHLAPFASVEMAPAKIGDDIYWLPTVVVGAFASGKTRGKFIAHYSNYHRYTGSMTILPGVNEVPLPPVPPPLAH